MSTEGKELTLGMDRQIVVTPDQMKVIKSTIFPESTDDELKLFIYHCQRKGVHPMDKLIHPIKRGGKMSLQAGIDYMRSESEIDGTFRGMRGPTFEFDEQNRLESATVVILRDIQGEIVEFPATAYWDEYVPAAPNDFMWKKMPRHMLGKCAEALARRMAFPKRLADLYTPEEMEQANNPAGAAGNRQQQRSNSVQPPPRQQQSNNRSSSRQQQEPEDAQFSEVSIDDQIMGLLADFTGGDYAEMNKLLEEVSGFQGSNGWCAIKSTEKLSSAAEKWKKGILKKLQEKRSGGDGREPGMEG